MPILDAIPVKLMTTARKERLAYLRSVPIRRLAVPILATFCIFTAIGLISSTTSTSPHRHLASEFFSAIFLGLTGGLYTYVAARRPVLAIPMACFQFGGMPLIHRWSEWIWRDQPVASFEAAARIYAPVTVTLIVLSYSMFIRFIQSEGRFAFRAQTELALAHSIQQTLVPVVDMELAGCAIYGLSLPSEKVGGDLVDAVALADGMGFAYLTDIAGHGLNAGILMGMVKTAVRTCLDETSNPGTLFNTLNRVLPAVKDAHMYATCAAFQMNPLSDGLCEFAYSLAGHPPVLRISASGKAMPQISDEQFPLGLLPFDGYQSRAFTASCGELIVAATDGILETCGKDGVELGINGLEAICARGISLPLPELAQQIFSAAQALGPQTDDRTLLLIRVL